MNVAARLLVDLFGPAVIEIRTGLAYQFMYWGLRILPKSEYLNYVRWQVRHWKHFENL